MKSDRRKKVNWRKQRTNKLNEEYQPHSSYRIFRASSCGLLQVRISNYFCIKISLIAGDRTIIEIIHCRVCPRERFLDHPFPPIQIQSVLYITSISTYFSGRLGQGGRVLRLGQARGPSAAYKTGEGSSAAARTGQVAGRCGQVSNYIHGLHMRSMYKKF